MNDRNRPLWTPFATIGAFLAAINVTALDVAPVPTGLWLCTLGAVVLLLAAEDGRLRSLTKRVRP